MSQWLRVEGHLCGVSTDLSGEESPAGSEGAVTLHALGAGFPGHWYFDKNLRDMGDDDVPGIRDWFAALCARVHPTDAELRTDDGDARYRWDWVDGQCVLWVPPLYQT